MTVSDKVEDFPSKICVLEMKCLERAKNKAGHVGIESLQQVWASLMFFPVSCEKLLRKSFMGVYLHNSHFYKMVCKQKLINTIQNIKTSRSPTTQLIIDFY